MIDTYRTMTLSHAPKNNTFCYFSTGLPTSHFVIGYLAKSDKKIAARLKKGFSVLVRVSYIYLETVVSVWRSR